MPPTAAESDMVVNLCVPYGAWKGHPAGEQVIDAAVGRAILRYFDAVRGRGKDATVIDYGHASLDDPDAPAAGWVYELFEDTEADPPGLYMRNTWTPRAKEGIDAAEYKYLSPVILRDYPDPVTGETVPWCLFNVALTNVPFMEDKFTRPVAASKALDGRSLFLNTTTISSAIQSTTAIKNQGGPMDPKQMLADAAAALGLPATASGDEVLGLVKKLVEFVGMLPGAPAAPAMPEMGEVMEGAVAASKTVAELATLFACKPSEVFANVATLKNSQPTDETKAQIAAMSRQLAEMKADRLISENEDRIAPKDRQFYRDLAVKDHDGAAAIIARFDKVIPAPPAKPNGKPAGDVPDDYEAYLNRALNIKKEEK